MTSRQEGEGYRSGVYRYHRPEGEPPVLYYDGAKWWLPGWEVGMHLTEEGHSYDEVPEARIGRLLWTEADELDHEHDDA